MKSQLFKSKNGSSLIFVMLIVAGIVTATLGTQRLALVQFGQSVADEDNIAAYYAAKAGIEDGLARFRFSRNASTVQTGNSNTAERYDLTTGQSLGYVTDTTAITSAGGYTPTHQYYDLKVDYKASSLTSIPIAQDNTLELTGFPDSASNYYLRFQFAFTNGLSGVTGCFVTIQQVSQTTTGTQLQPQVVVSQNGAAYDSAAQGTNLLIKTTAGSGSVANFVRIRPYADSPANATQCGNGLASGALTASFSTVTGSTGSTAANINFDSTVTKITATGYVGSVKRTLIATVDRKSGSLISIYDFSLYGGTGNISP